MVPGEIESERGGARREGKRTKKGESSPAYKKKYTKNMAGSGLPLTTKKRQIR